MAKRPLDRGDELFSDGRFTGNEELLRGGGTGGGRGGKKSKGRRPRAADARPDVPDDGVVRVSRERRRGKGMTVVTGVPLTGKDLNALGKQLKQRCGSGGTTKDGVIEIQGDHRDTVVAALQERGWTVKKVGG